MKALLLCSLVVLVSGSVYGQSCVDRAKVVEPVMSQETRGLYAANLAFAKQAFEKNPKVAEEAIWLGRRLGYLGQYKEAIAVFSRGIRDFPQDARFYRHRGHRLLTLRCFKDAISDFETAAKLIKGKSDSIEPDGIPNEKNIPTSTLQSNIWYHLGLAYYLTRDHKRAEAAYAEAAKVATNNDMRVATAYWRYMNLRRAGKKREAERVLEPFAGEIDVIENGEYLKLVKLNRGELMAEELMKTLGEEANSLGSASLAYGIGNYFYYNSDREEAMNIFRRIVEGDQWASFGYIAAEAEIGSK